MYFFTSGNKNNSLGLGKIMIDLPLVEPIAVQEVYIDGIARIEQMGPCLKLTFFTFQRPAGGAEHDMERVVVARFVMPAEAVASAAMQAMAVADTALFMDKVH